MDIAGKVFIVTGGASGLGEGTARMLAAKGGKVGSYFERFKCLEQIFTWFSGREHDDEVPSCLLVSVCSCFRCLYYWGRAGRQPA